MDFKNKEYRNFALRKAQALLKKFGYYNGEVDGIEGPLTKEAVKAFQKATDNLYVDGIFGKLTFAALKTEDRIRGGKIPPGEGKTLMDERSEANLVGVHPDLVKVVRRAAEMHPVEFIVTEGLRSVARQRELMKRGASKTMNSRHLTGHAVDLAIKDENGGIDWSWPPYRTLARTMKAAADQLGVPIQWGGDWKTFRDGPHYQLTWSDYPMKHIREYVGRNSVAEPDVLAL